MPIHPEFVAMLRAHLDAYGTGQSGRIFIWPRGGLMTGRAYLKVLHEARAKALTPGETASPLLDVPCALRHAAVSTWLRTAGDPARVAEWAGHSVVVLLRVYAKCIHGMEEEVLQRISVRAVFTNRNPVANGVYTGLISFQVINSGSADSQQLSQEPDNGPPDHLWSFTAASGGYVTITNTVSKLVLDIANGSTAAGAPVISAQPTGALSQQWRLVYDTDGYYVIENANSGLLLTIADDSLSADGRAVQAGRSNADSQRWGLGTDGT